MGYDFTENVNAFVAGRARVAFPDEEETRVLSGVAAPAPSEDVADGFDTAWAIPVIAGLEVEI